MKRIFLITFLLFSFQFLIAQNCKAKKTRMDEMTEKQIEYWGGKIGGVSTILTGKGYDVEFYTSTDSDKNDAPYAVLVVTHKVPAIDAAIFDAVFEEGQSYLIKTENGIIEMPVEKVLKSNKRFLDNYSVTNQLLGYISKELAEKLANGKLEMFRAISSNGHSVEGKIGKKDAVKLQEQFKCFLQKI